MAAAKTVQKKVCQTKQKSPANNNKQRRQVDLARFGTQQKQKKVPDLANVGRRYGNKVVIVDFLTNQSCVMTSRKVGGRRR